MPKQALKLGRRPLVVGTVTTAAGLRRAAGARRLPCDAVEVRLDRVGPASGTWPADLRRLARARVPVILTIRSAREGGAWRGREAARAALYRAALADVAAVDVEAGARNFPALARAARRAGCLVIGSYHNFRLTPGAAALRRAIRGARARGADVVKLATRIRSAGDAARLLELLRGAGEGPLCVIGMDPRRRATRLRLARAGSCLAYGYLDRSAAPGQVQARELARRLRRG